METLATEETGSGKRHALILTERECFLLYGCITSGPAKNLRGILGEEFTMVEELALKDKLLRQITYLTETWMREHGIKD